MRSCPKCSYVRKAEDKATPDWQCPNCGIAYEKFLARQNPAPAAAARAPTMVAHPAASASAKTMLFILAAVVVVVYVGYKGFNSHKAQVQSEPTESITDSRGEVLSTSNPAFYGTMEAGGPVLRMKPSTAAGLAQIAPGKVVMFATSWCPYCAKARDVFRAQNVRYTELDIERDRRSASFQKDVMGLSGYPVIVIGDRVILGFDEGAILAGLKEL